jgi:hypothetical protein
LRSLQLHHSTEPRFGLRIQTFFGEFLRILVFVYRNKNMIPVLILAVITGKSHSAYVDNERL